jgi:GNAT superfamily N-acetyltransferase
MDTGVTASTMPPAAAVRLTVVPANEAPWPDLQAIFGTTAYPGTCFCQHFKIRDRDWRSVAPAERQNRLRRQTNCDDPQAPATSGLVGYLDGDPVGWVAVEPRIAFQRLRYSQTPWRGRDEDQADPGVWAVTCFVTRKGYRKRGITYALAAATVDFARARGAQALEAYPMSTEPGKELTWGELYVGSHQVFAAAGFTEVSHPSLRRFVMRIDFTN